MSLTQLREPAIGELDCLVRVREWSDTPAMSFGVDQHFDTGVQAWARIQPVGTATFYGTQQVGTEVTHRLTTWLTTRLNAVAVDQRHVVEYAGIRYRVKRATDVNGRRAFVMLDLEQLGAIP